MTEQNVLDFYRPNLIGLIYKCSSHIPFEDALSVSHTELLLALRNYHPAYHGVFWADYAAPRIRAKLKDLQKQQNTLRRKERVSLDAAVTDDTETTFGQFLLVSSPKVNRIELWELLSHAPYNAQQVGWRIIDKYSKAEIQSDLHISEQEYQGCLCALQKAWESYNQGVPGGTPIM